VLCLRWGTHNVLDVSNPNDKSPRIQRRATAVRRVSASLVALSLGGLLAAGVVGTPTPAHADVESNLTVKWAGDTSTAKAFQPSRLTVPSGHYNEMQNIAITVSQTTGLIDQAIRVSVTGFAGTQSAKTAEGGIIVNAKNYLQAMQCWGTDPTDPKFRETCQWGGRYGVAPNGLGETVIRDNASRVGPQDIVQSLPTTHDVSFRTVDGQTFSGKPRYKPKSSDTYPIQDIISPSTTNEVVSARVGSKGAGFFDFETQSSVQAPQMGCGTSAHLRCWLVVVPRGTVFGGDQKCSDIPNPKDPELGYYFKGQTGAIQGGSPINDQCDYWDNRIVIPLDFTPTGNTCPVGGTEVRVIGSQLMVGAMSSWQPSLCQTVKSTFSFSTNPDSVARAQLIDTSKSSPAIAYSGYPVSSGELLTDSERTTLGKTKLAYVPVAVSSVVIGFIAEFADGRQEKLNISPRIMAKILTQSYPFLVPSSSSEPAKQVAHLAAANRSYTALNLDPDFQAINPSNYQQFPLPPAIVLPGPSGADAIRQVWRWITADPDATAFLNGAEDPWKMKINPYYLPKGNVSAQVPWYFDSNKDYIDTPTNRAVGLSNIDGTPQKIAESNLDNFPRDDETLAPLKLSAERSRFDSIQFAPYTDNLLTAARQGFRADPNSRSIWDPNRINTNGTTGDWISTGTQVPGAKFIIVITDSPSASRYGLSVASVQVPGNKLAFVQPTATGMTTALSAMAPTSLDNVKQVDPKLVTAAGYPMTIVTYAGVNLTKTTAAARTTIASMLKQVTTTGQVSGTELGELPFGYVPLTADLLTLADTGTKAIQSFVPPTATTTTTTATTNIAQDSFDSGSSTTDIATLAAANDPQVTTGGTTAQTGRTETIAADQVVARTGIALSLGVGLAGLLVAPILFRGRGHR